jgi:hypothetical protein
VLQLLLRLFCLSLWSQNLSAEFEKYQNECLQILQEVLHLMFNVSDDFGTSLWSMNNRPESLSHAKHFIDVAIYSIFGSKLKSLLLECYENHECEPPVELMAGSKTDSSVKSSKLVINRQNSNLARDEGKKVTETVEKKPKLDEATFGKPIISKRNTSESHMLLLSNRTVSTSLHRDVRLSVPIRKSSKG